MKTRAVQVAAGMLGGPRKLRDRLRVSSADVVSWLSGAEEPPRAVFLRAVDLILNGLDMGSARLGESECVKAGSVQIVKVPRSVEPK